MRLGLIWNKDPVTARISVLSRVVRSLEDRGVEVRAVWPPNGARLSSPICDLYLLKTKTAGSFAFAARLEASGASLLNSFSVTTTLHDKLDTCHLLARGGVPVPRTWEASSPDDVLPALGEGPVIIKPRYGSRGRGINVVHDPHDFAGVHWDQPLLAQRYVPHVAPDLKIFAIGGQLFGLNREWPALTWEQKLGKTCPLDVGMQTLARRCGAVFGIEMFGIDVIFRGGSPYVVDMSSFPGFKGVPGAASALTDHVMDLARRGSQAPTRERDAS